MTQKPYSAFKNVPERDPTNPTMIPIKIECSCGQHYAFEVEPVHGRMPSSIACPVCGIDGTDAANEAIAQTMGSQAASVVSPPQANPVRVTPSSPAPVAAAPVVSTTTMQRSGMMRGLQANRTQAEHEARAKIMWGDPPEEVVKYLRLQGLSAEEASELIQPLLIERAVTVRANGVRNIVIGSLMACVPVIAFIIFMSMKYIPMKLFALTVMVGLYGVYKLFNGIFMFVAPKSEPGDVGEQ